MKKKTLIGLTYGDPAGIGPEILVKTLRSWRFKKLIPLVIGNSKYLKSFKAGKPDKETGKYAIDCLVQAVKLGIAGKIKAIITGPVSKKIIDLSKPGFVGQTEEIARICKINKDKAMMVFIRDDLRIALFTRHIPLKEVSSKITRQKLKNFILLVNKYLKKYLHISKPKIAVLGLNPHAGENGLFGDEEIKIIKPAIKNIPNTYGPMSPDATLSKAGQDYLNGKKQKYDIYISFYHDQALPMFKAVCGFKGLNVTLGLPFIRVSPDHGTAFDIAGKNKAVPSGMIEALKFLENVL